MKKQFAIIFLVLFTMTFFTQQSNAQGSCPDVVASSCFGDCGGSNVIVYNVASSHRGAQQFCVEGLGGNLCGLISASATVSVNGSAVASGDITSGLVRFHARAGDDVTVSVSTTSNPRIFCLVAGSYNFQLRTKSH